MNWDQLWVGLGLAVPATLLGYLGLRRSQKVDADAARSGLFFNHREGTAQVIEGLRGLIEDLQDDNESFRADVRYLTDRLDAVTAERDALKLEVARLRRKYGDNGDTPQPPNKGTP